MPSIPVSPLAAKLIEVDRSADFVYDAIIALGREVQATQDENPAIDDVANSLASAVSSMKATMIALGRARVYLQGQRRESVRAIASTLHQLES